MPPKSKKGLLLTVSITVNVALIALFFRGSIGDRDRSEFNQAGFRGLATEGQSRDAVWGENSRREGTESVKGLLRITLPSVSKREFANWLADEGVPTHLIYGIIDAQLLWESAARRAEVAFPTGMPYWRRLSGQTLRSEESLQLRQEQVNAMQEAVQDLPPMISETNLRRDRLAFGDISPDKVSKIREIEQTYMVMRQRASGAAGGVNEDRNQMLRVIEEEREREIQAVLTTAELRDYQLRSSEISVDLMRKLEDIEVAEEQFVALFDLFDQWNREYKYSINDISSRQMASTAMNRVLEETIGILGGERAVSFLRSEDARFRELHGEFGDLANSEALLTVWKEENLLSAKAAALAEDKSLDRDGRAREVAKLVELFDRRVQENLDQVHYTRYLEKIRPRLASRLSSLARPR